MTKFITLHMLLEQTGGKGKSRWDNSPPRLSEAPAFLSWKIGYRVKPRGNDDVYTIDAIDTDAMSYNSKVTLKNVADETRTLKGATLQSGYAFVDMGDVRAPEPAPGEPEEFGVPTKPLTVQVSQIRDFYPRKNDMPGTRVILVSGTAYAVANKFEKIAAAVEAVSV